MAHARQDRDVLVIIPTYNERENIERIVKRTREATPLASILIVDDASPDGTGLVADGLAAADAQVCVMHRSAKEGLGAAYIAGFSWGLQRGFDRFVEMDADGSHQPEELPRLLEALEESDLVLGSRWVAGGEVINWPMSRRILSRAGNLYARLLLGLRLRDATGGFRAFRRVVLQNIDLESEASQGYCFQIDLAWRTITSGFRVQEVPITFVERESGTSKMSRAIIWGALWRVAVWGIQRRLGLSRFKPLARHH